MFSLFRKSSVPLSAQLSELAKAGIFPAAGVTEDDWISFYELAEYVAAPYQNVIEVLGCPIQRKPYSPICNRMWMCDYECIEDYGDYQKILERLQVLSGGSLPVSNIADFVDIEQSKAWLEFDLEGKRVHWDAQVDNDWLDPYIIVKFDALLRDKTDLLIYSNHTDFGQSALFACMTESEFSIFGKLSKVKLDETRKQA
jgi:hypothetical protein